MAPSGLERPNCRIPRSGDGFTGALGLESPSAGAVGGRSHPSGKQSGSAPSRKASPAKPGVPRRKEGSLVEG
jgi:hypothetical protein